jgi:hypothetical protein
MNQQERTEPEHASAYGEDPEPNSCLTPLGPSIEGILIIIDALRTSDRKSPK